MRFTAKCIPLLLCRDLQSASRQQVQFRSLEQQHWIAGQRSWTAR
jgi:hypothetical protein